VIEIPEEYRLSGDLFYPLCYTGGFASFTGVCADPRYPTYPGLETYCWNVLWASATENSRRQVASCIVVEKSASSEPDANGETVVLSQFGGMNPSGNNYLYWNDDATPKIGQRFNIGTKALKQLTVNALSTFMGYRNIFTVTFWQWNDNYATTTAATPLYVYNGTNHPDSTDFVLNIPADVVLTGDIYYEIEVLTNNGVFVVFMTWIGSSPIKGLVSYRGGMAALGHYAARIVVELGDEVETPPETEVDTTPETEVDLSGYDVIVLGKFNGKQNSHNKWGSQPFGQKFTLPEGYALKGLTINSLTTFIDDDDNTWTIKIWQWNANSSVTTFSEPLYEVSGKNHPDGKDFVVGIPDGVLLTGEIYYELYYTSGATGFTGWVTNESAEGVISFVDGSVMGNNFASSIHVAPAVSKSRAISMGFSL